jgi:hypothetical protein
MNTGKDKAVNFIMQETKIFKTMPYISCISDPTLGTDRFEKHELKFEDFLCDLDDKNKKVRITYSYFINGEDLTVEEWRVKKLDQFIMNDEDITLSMMEVLLPVTNGYNISYCSQLIIE